MNINEVIKRPVLTEKSYAQMSEGVYVFQVDRRTNKVEVRKAIEFIFDVKVAKVNIVNVAKKPTRVGNTEGFKSGWKKAIVTLLEGEINIFPDDEPTTVEVTKEEEIKEVSDAEKRAAEKIAAKKAVKEIEAEAKETETK